MAGCAAVTLLGRMPRGWLQNRPMTRRRATLAVGLGLAFLALAALAMATEGVIWGYRHDGPIRHEGQAGVRWRLPGGATSFTWTMPLPLNPTSDDFVLEAIDPVDITGFELLGVAVAYGCGLPTLDLGYPPARVVTQSVQRAVWPAAGPAGNPACDDIPTAVLGLRLQKIAGSGAIHGLRVRYVYRGIRYETVLHLHLEINKGHENP